MARQALSTADTAQTPDPVKRPRQDNVQFTLTSNLPNTLPILPEEIDLMARYFGDLIKAALAGEL